MILIIDNYDSFVFNIARYFEELGAAPRVIRNDAPLDWVKTLAPEAVVISPGPCSPREAGNSLEVLEHFAGNVPVLGVCLGHQCIGAHFGGEITRSKRPCHGRIEPIRHRSTGLFKDLPSPMPVGRYNSLTVTPNDAMNSQLSVDALSDSGEIMALSHKSLPIFGVQFHPESILTQHGYGLLQNFLDRVAQHRNEEPHARSLA